MLSALLKEHCLLFVLTLLTCRAEDGKIVGGYFADQSEFSFVVSVQEKSRFNSSVIYSHRCGGTLVNPWFVFTAAHCVSWRSLKNGVLHPRLAADFVVLTGTRDIKVLEPGARFRPVDEIILNEGFREHSTLTGFWLGDMALLKLIFEVEDYSFTRSVVFPREERTESQLNELKSDKYRLCLHPGWWTGRSGVTSSPSFLKFLWMKVLPDDQCDRMFCKAYPDSCGVYNATKLEVICALSEYQSWSPCFAGSGTPLVCDGRFFGMHVSSRYSCGMADVPENYISVLTVRRFFRALNSYRLLNRGEQRRTSFILFSVVMLTSIKNSKEYLELTDSKDPTLAYVSGYSGH
ncbi:trypsin-like [Cimex lectularius]|uniref:Peptidase S1 domain-containing protein n=1 Tax=Cimex lectularius TaxID=79782 RepID=A0A8I6TLT2_CIMLE|nr:trypsin-like [Cimex lectularius]